MHVLTQKKLERFTREFGFEGEEYAKFERYVASHYLYQYVRDDVDKIEQCVFGGGSDEGIDIAAVTVNGQLATEPKDVEEIISGSYSNIARIIFVQAKTSESYDAKMVAKFLHGVESVTKYAMKPGSIALPADLVDTALLIDKIAENLDRFQHDTIPCDLYYVTTSSNETSSIANELQVSEAIHRIRGFGVYPNDLQLHLHGHADIAAKQRERHGPQNVKFIFSKRQTIPETGNVAEAFIGILPASELLQLLQDENGEQRPGIFDDNVRLDLGSQNPVNSRIGNTLASDEREYFPFLNNGLTIVASRLSSVSDRFTISGYQVVNGGQSSNQILRWAASASVRANPEVLKSIWVPVKIVSSEDANVRSSIAVATNLQTPINASDIQASSEIAKRVEEYFALSGAEGLRFERQQRGDSIDFPRTRIVNTSELNRAVASVLSGESARAISSPRELEGDESFVWGEYPAEAFYYAAWIVYRIDRYFGRKSEDSVLRAAKYHIAMLVSATLNPKFVKGFESDGVEISRRLLLNPKGIRFSIVESRIESAISDAAVFARHQFAPVLAEGRSLRRDDVRNRRSQEELLQRAIAARSGRV